MANNHDHVGADLRLAIDAYDRAFRQSLDKAGFKDVSVAEAQVLELVNSGASSIVGIARTRGVTKQAIQGQVQSLVKQGYVSLGVNPSDARQRAVNPTQEGHQLVAALLDQRAVLHDQLEIRLGTERLKNMRNMLAQVRATFD